MQLTAGWSVELDGAWERRHRRRTRSPEVWTGPVGSLHVEAVHTATTWRCASELQLLDALGDEVPPAPVGRIGEPGTDGIGHRAAWLYADALWGYTFVDGQYLRTAFLSADADLRWAFAAWRSVRLDAP